MLRSALVLAIAATLAAPGLAHAAAGDLDPSLSGDGKVVTSVSDGDSANGVAIDSRNRIVVAGYADDGKVAVARYLPGGRLDPSFSDDGKVLFRFADGSSRAQAVAIDSRDRVIVAGVSSAAGQRRTTDFGVARLTTGGKLDPSFSDDGKVVTHPGGSISKDSANSVAVDSAGRIVAAGSSRVGGQWAFTLVRYRPDGTLDPSFSGDGKARTKVGEHSDNSANSVAIDSAGRIVVAGVSNDNFQDPSRRYRSAVARYLPNGNLDSTFSGDGRQVLVYSNEQLWLQSVAVDDRNRIVLAGLDYVFQRTVTSASSACGPTERWTRRSRPTARQQPPSRAERPTPSPSIPLGGSSSGGMHPKPPAVWRSGSPAIRPAARSIPRSRATAR